MANFVILCPNTYIELFLLLIKLIVFSSLCLIFQSDLNLTTILYGVHSTKIGEPVKEKSNLFLKPKEKEKAHCV